MSVTPFNYPLHIANSLNRSNDYLKGTSNGIPSIVQQLPNVQDPTTKQIVSQLANSINNTNHAIFSLANSQKMIQNPEVLEQNLVAAPVLMYLA
jgi:hypothetical protein